MKAKAAERSQKPPASLFQAPPEEETISLSKHVWRNPPPHPHPHPAGPQCPSYITMKSGWLRVCVNWAGLWFHSLAGQTWPLGAARTEQACHLAPDALALFSLPADTPSRAAGWTVHGKAVRNPPGAGLGFPAKLSML